MSIQNRRQLENSQNKLRLLEARLRELDTEPVSNGMTRALTKRSLTRLANQLREEILRFEVHASLRTEGPGK